MNFFTKLFLTALCISAISSCKQENSNEIKIGIIEPIEHTAMNEIASGFSDTLAKLYHKPVVIKIENAQNDPNLERAIIQKMHDAGYSMIVPIGVDATQMTRAIIHEKPIVSLASDLTDNDRKKLKPCNMTAVHDEIEPEQLLDFIHAVYPNLKRLTLIHSAANKVLPEVEKTIAAGKLKGITIDHKMVATLPELYSAAQSFKPGTQAIFILKDHMIVSGITTLAKIAADKHLPLITSDEGSVEAGAGFSLGVHEREIGVEGAKLAASILNGKSACELPIVTVKNLTVFINQKSLEQESQDKTLIINAAKQFSYSVAFVDLGK